MKIFDMHSHYSHGAKYDSKKSEIYNPDLSFQLGEYDRLGIVGGGFSSFDSVVSAENIISENEYTANLAEKNKKVYQWAVLDPRSKDNFKQVKELLFLKKTLGIKIHSVYHGYDILEYARQVFDFASETKATVLMHPDKILEVAKIMDEYPNAKLIIAHLGSLEHIKALKDSKHNNIYTDTSGSASATNNLLEYAVKELGTDRIAFGSDTYSLAFQIGRVKLSSLTNKQKADIFYNVTKNLLFK